MCAWMMNEHVGCLDKFRGVKKYSTCFFMPNNTFIESEYLPSYSTCLCIFSEMRVHCARAIFHPNQIWISTVIQTQLLHTPKELACMTFQIWRYCVCGVYSFIEKRLGCPKFNLIFQFLSNVLCIRRYIFDCTVCM